MGFRNYFVCLHYCDFLWWNYWICDIHAFANIKVLQYWKWSRSLFWFWNLVSQNHSLVDMSNTPCLKTGLSEVIVLIPASSRDLFFQNLTVKFFWKLVHICWSCREMVKMKVVHCLRHGVCPFRYAARHFLPILSFKPPMHSLSFPFLPIPASLPIHLPVGPVPYYFLPCLFPFLFSFVLSSFPNLFSPCYDWNWSQMIFAKKNSLNLSTLYI